MGLSPYVLGGVLSGAGQGIREGVGTIVARRKEDEERRRQRAREDRDDRRLDLQEQRQNDAYNRAIMEQDAEWSQKGGIIEDDPNDNGTGKVGFIVGTSTATTQPSEHEHDGVKYRYAGSYGGKRYELPADGLTAVERAKARGRSARVSNAQSAFPNLKLTPGQLAALEDPEQGDQLYQTYANQNFELDPANVRNKAAIAGAQASARLPSQIILRETAPGRSGGDGLTPYQQAMQDRMLRTQRIGQARTDETQARQDMRENKAPKKEAFGATTAGFSTPEDSLLWVDASNKAFGNRTDAGMRAAEAQATQMSLTMGEDEISAGRRLQQEARRAYELAFRQATTRAQQEEALALYRSLEAKALSMQGRRPTK